MFTFNLILLKFFNMVLVSSFWSKLVPFLSYLYIIIACMHLSFVYCNETRSFEQNVDNAQKGEPSDLKLEFIQILWRHGDRSPVIEFPTDPYKNYWPQGTGMLTQQGMRQHYALGKFLRNHYVSQRNFISEHYLRNETYVFSSNIDRAIESAASNLASFYKPEDWQIWDPNLLWQPVPIHTVPEDEDHFLDVPEMKCPKWVYISAQFMNSDEYKEEVEKYSSLLNYLTESTGMEIDMTTASLLDDWIVCVKAHNLTLPDWATEEVVSDLSDLSTFEFFNEFRTKEQQRLMGGSLLNTLREMFLNKINPIADGAAYADKFIVYSAHDTTIIALTKLLDVFNNQKPPYAAAVIWELYSDKSNNYYVKMLYRNTTNENSSEAPHELHLPFCSSVLCQWAEFYNNTADLIVTDWKRECRQFGFMSDIMKQRLHEGGHVTRFMIMAFVFGLGTLFIFAGLELYCYYVKRRVLNPANMKLEVSF